jgi:hypothetical protein
MARTSLRIRVEIRVMYTVRPPQAATPTHHHHHHLFRRRETPHPREYIRSHKLEIEAWDSYAWKQLLNAFDALKNAWDGRAKELGPTIAQYQQQLTYGGGGYYTGQIQQEVARLQGVRFSFAFYILPSFMLLPSC